MMNDRNVTASSTRTSWMTFLRTNLMGDVSFR